MGRRKTDLIAWGTCHDRIENKVSSNHVWFVCIVGSLFHGCYGSSKLSRQRCPICDADFELFCLQGSDLFKTRQDIDINYCITWKFPDGIKEHTTLI